MAEILHQLRLVVYPIIYRVSYIPGGCLGFQPSTVVSGCSPPILKNMSSSNWIISPIFLGENNKIYSKNHHLGYEAMKAFRAILVRKILVWKILYGDFCFCVGCFFGLFFWWDVFVIRKGVT